MKKKKQTAVKGASSALIVSIAVHVLLLFAAGAFVAVSVIQRSETKFQGKQIVRPKMQLKKLQVPVKVEQKVRQQAPALNQRVTAPPKLTTKAVDFKMPEMSGFGSGVNITGGGFRGSLGFATTQLNVFGLKSRGEKVVFILSTDDEMLTDDIGGIPAYTIIKQELINLIGSLPPTTLFNVVVYSGWNGVAFSGELSSASDANVKQLKAWLDPLNADKKKYGLQTLASKGHPVSFEPMGPIYNKQTGWLAGFSYALQKGADSIYWLTRSGGPVDMSLDHWTQCEEAGAVVPFEQPEQPEKTDKPEALEMSPKQQKEWDEWNELVEKAKQKLKEDNEARLAKGKPVRVLKFGYQNVGLVQAYFPGEKPPEGQKRSNVKIPPKKRYSAREVLDYINAMSAHYGKKDRREMKIGLSDKEVSVNIVQFVPKDQPPPKFKPWLESFGPEVDGYKQIQGLEEIQSYVQSQ
jgi:hypothetical protein